MTEYLTVFLSPGSTESDEQEYKLISDISSLSLSINDLEKALTSEVAGFKLVAVELAKATQIVMLIENILSSLNVEYAITQTDSEIKVELIGEGQSDDANFALASLAFVLVRENVWDNYPAVDFG